ncbi:MAG: LPS export ABC transporter periplasmic protein LptC [Euryarchaeota archaeon]|nr:LPS export ABC transporter periplasmic protein LptC [Euryarchaeota archaeon]
MNFFLHINRRIFIIFLLLVIIFLIALIYTKQISLNNNLQNVKIEMSNVDIEEPRFAINNDEKKINITANEGNFLNKDEVLLRENVKFKSNDFIIETENVIFDRKKETAKSKTKSMFKSKNTTIFSDGFNIYDQGNKITFYGKSFIVLK